MSKKRKTAGELEMQALADHTKYRADEIAEEATKGVADEVIKCALAHHKIIDEPVFFVIMLLGDDNVLKTVVRRKFYAYPFLPQPRPNQSVWSYHKKTQDINLMWALPDPEAMAYMSTMGHVHPLYKNMKTWCDWFYSGKFPHHVREAYNQPDWLTESEYLQANRAKLTETLKDCGDALATESGNSTKIGDDEVGNLLKAVAEQDARNVSRKAENSNSHIITH